VEESGRDLINLRFYPGIFLKGLKETTKNLSKDSQSSGVDLNLEPPEYEAGPIDHDFRCLIVLYGM
jgi:hypothetical protein